MKPEITLRGRLETSLEETYSLSLSGSEVRFTGHLMDSESILTTLEGFCVAAGNSMALYLTSPHPLPEQQEFQYALMLGTFAFDEGVMNGYFLSQRRPMLTPVSNTLKKAYEQFLRNGLGNDLAGSYLERFHTQIKSSFMTEEVTLYWETCSPNH